MITSVIYFALFLAPSSSQQALLPPPHYGTRRIFHRENNPALSSLVSSRRIVLTHAIKRSRQLVSLQNNLPLPRFEPLTPTLVVFEVSR